jgi:hypothetical protein
MKTSEKGLWMAANHRQEVLLALRIISVAGAAESVSHCWNRSGTPKPPRAGRWLGVLTTWL